MSATLTRTFYDVLGLDKYASSEDIKNAYKKMALRYHPDKNPGDVRAVACFQEIGEAYETLYDHTKRTQYNTRLGHDGAQSRQTGAAPSFHHFTTHFHSAQRPRHPGSHWTDRTSSYPQRPYEDWENMPFTEPDQDWFEKWMEEQRIIEAEKLKAKVKRRELQRKKRIGEIRVVLADILCSLAQLENDICKAEEEKRAADAIIMSWRVDNGTEIFEEVFERNVMLSKLKRELESKIKEYRRLCSELKKLDIMQGEEVERAFSKKQKTKSDCQKEAAQEPIYNADDEDRGQHLSSDIDRLLKALEREKATENARNHAKRPNAQAGGESSSKDSDPSTTTNSEKVTTAYLRARVAALKQKQKQAQKSQSDPAKRPMKDTGTDTSSRDKDNCLNATSDPGHPGDLGARLEALKQKARSKNAYTTSSRPNSTKDDVIDSPRADAGNASHGASQSFYAPASENSATTKSHPQESFAIGDERWLHRTGTSTANSSDATADASIHQAEHQAPLDFNTQRLLFLEQRAKHAAHRDVRGDFWSFAADSRPCTFCGMDYPVLQCPEFDTCGAVACEWCKT